MYLFACDFGCVLVGIIGVCLLVGLLMLLACGPGIVVLVLCCWVGIFDLV